MRGWKLAVLMTICGQRVDTQAPVYRASSSSPDNSLYKLEGDSTPLNTQGTLRVHALREVPPRSWAAFNVALAADTLLYRYVTLSAEVRVTSAPQGASLWAIVAGSAGAIATPGTRDKPVRGTTDWTPVALTVRIDPRAKNIGFGIRFDGGGTMEARNVRLVAAPQSIAVTSPTAKAYLDSAIALAQARAYWSDTVSWKAVTSEVHALAQGATTPRDTHEAIRYLLSRIGDHHSFFAPPANGSAGQSPNTPAAAAVPPVDVQLLGDGITRVTVPGYTRTDSISERQYVTELHLKLAAVRGTADFAPSRSPISVEADHPFRSKAITHFAPSRSPVSVEADQGVTRDHGRSPQALLLRDFNPERGGARRATSHATGVRGVPPRV